MESIIEMCLILNKIKRCLSKSSMGFTLIELVVILLILGLLAGIAVPYLLNSRSSGYVAAANEERASVQTAVNAWEAATKKPFSELDMPEGREGNNNDLAPYLRGKVKGIYVADHNSGKVTAVGIGTWPDSVSTDPFTGGFKRS